MRVGPLYFVPRHCDFILSFDKPCMHKLMDADVRAVKLVAVNPHNSSFRVGDKVTVNCHIGEYASEYNCVCACGSNCMSLVKWFVTCNGFKIINWHCNLKIDSLFIFLDLVDERVWIYDHTRLISLSSCRALLNFSEF